MPVSTCFDAQCMKEMREVIRSDDMDAALANLLPRLEKAVLDSEQRRETRVEQMGTALTALAAAGGASAAEELRQAA